MENSQNRIEDVKIQSDLEEFIFDDNASILNLLPELLQDFIEFKTPDQALMQYLSQQLSSLTERDSDRKQELKSLSDNIHKELYKMGDSNDSDCSKQLIPILNQEKSLFLLHLFGEVYINAISILSDSNNIEVNVFTGTTYSNSEPIANDYLHCTDTESPSDAFIVVKVKEQRKRKEKENRNHNVNYKNMPSKYDLNTLLELNGLKVSATGSIQRMFSTSVENRDIQEMNAIPTMHTYTSHVVDIESWYCSCPKYHAELAETFTKKNHHFADIDNLLKAVPTKIPNLLKRILTQYTQDKRSKHPHRLVMCAHILALLMASFNSDQTNKLYHTRYLSNVYDMIT